MQVGILGVCSWPTREKENIMLTIRQLVAATLSASLLTGLALTPAHAGDGNIVQNPGFEITDSTLVNIPDWTPIETGGAIVKRRPGAANAHRGSNSAILSLSARTMVKRPEQAL